MVDTGDSPSKGGQGKSGQNDDKDRDGDAKGRRNRLLLIFGAVLVVAGAIFGGWWWYDARHYASTDDAYVGADIVTISPLVSGRVVAVEAQANRAVKSGDILVKIDDSQALAQVDAAKAAVAQAKAAQSEADAKLAQAKANARAQGNGLDGARARARDARALADRYATVVEGSGQTTVSAQTLLDAKTAADAAEADAASAESALAAARASVTAAEAGLEAAKAGVAAASAALEERKVTLSHYTVSADIAGTVTQRSVNVGSFVQPGAQLLSLVPNDLYITANFKETQITDIRPGQHVSIEVDAFPGVQFNGTVESIQRGAGQAFQLLPAQNASGNFVKVVQRVPVRIAWGSPSPLDYNIGPGMSVVVTVSLTGN